MFRFWPCFDGVLALHKRYEPATVNTVVRIRAPVACG
jgi:hypothetical protein